MKLREPFIFFTDRCLGGKEAPEAIRSVLLPNESLERLDDQYARDAKDAVWIPEVGARGLIILTKDSAIRRNPLEQQALRAAQTAVFILANGNINSAQIAFAFKLALPRIRTATRRFHVPVLGRVTVSGEVSVFHGDGDEFKPPKKLK